MHTYCPELWSSLTIDNRGNVYCCCLIKPACMGNIYSTTLKDMVNAPNIVRERVKSRDGKLECYPTCNWLDKARNTFGPFVENMGGYVDYDRMAYLHLNFGEKCNISCVMCKQRARYHTNPWVLDPDVLIRNIDVTPFKDIVVQGGEPLVIPECIRYLDYLGSIGKKYTLLTNGLLIDDEMADKLSKDAKTVCISLNSASKDVHELVNRGSSWQRIMDNIRRLAEARSRNGTEMEVWGRMTITTYSLHEVPKFLRLWQSFGFDHINFGYDRGTVPSQLAANPEYSAKLRNEVSNELLGMDLSKMDILRLKQLGLVGEVG
jgi:sulfatase maturation enzyme AslB (radical SAM superfamily)